MYVSKDLRSQASLKYYEVASSRMFHSLSCGSGHWHKSTSFQNRKTSFISMFLVEIPYLSYYHYSHKPFPSHLSPGPLLTLEGGSVAGD